MTCQELIYLKYSRMMAKLLHKFGIFPLFSRLKGSQPFAKRMARLLSVIKVNFFGA